VSDAVNLNDDVWVKLTEFGWEVYDDHHKGVPIETDKLRALLGDGEWQRFQLWELMSIYGSRMYNGAPRLPFEGNRLSFVDPAS
jgi:hypothetical protein